MNDHRRPARKELFSVATPAASGDGPTLEDPGALRDFVERLDEGIYITDPDGRIVDGNPALVRIFGADSLDQLKQRRIGDFMVDTDMRHELERTLRSRGAVRGLEYQILRLDNALHWVRDVAYAQDDEKGQVAAYQGMLVDITEQKRAEHALRESEEKYRSIFENVPDVYYRTNMEGQIVEVSPAVYRYLGYDRHELIGQPADTLYPNPRDRELLRNRVLTDGEVTDYEILLKGKDDRLVWFSVNARTIIDENDETIGFEGLLRDITHRKELERRLEELSVRDPLTGCYNRRHLERVRARLERPTSRWGCIVIDLDNFKAVNDNYGHEEGDRVLQGVAHFIRRHGRAEDVVVRLGGDEFAIIVSAASPEELEGIADRLLEVSPFESPAAFSLGYAYRNVGERVEEVVASADRSMYAAKGRGLEPPTER